MQSKMERLSTLYALAVVEFSTTIRALSVQYTDTVKAMDMLTIGRPRK